MIYPDRNNLRLYFTSIKKIYDLDVTRKYITKVERDCNVKSCSDVYIPV